MDKQDKTYFNTPTSTNNETSAQKIEKDNHLTSEATTQQQKLQQIQDIQALISQLETLQRQYNMEKLLWIERVKTKEEEIKSIKAQVAEREQVLRSEFKRKTEEIELLKQKILELESKIALQQTLSQEKIKAKEDEIKELKLKFQQEENKLKEEITLLQSQIKLKEEEIQQLNKLIGEREVVLNSQLQWKQQELLMERARFESELRKQSEELIAEKKRVQEELEKKNIELESLKSQLSAEIVELKLRYVEEQRRADKLQARLEEIQKELFMRKASFEMLEKQIEELRHENKRLKEVVYIPENITKIKLVEAEEEISHLKFKISSLQNEFAQEKAKMEKELKQKEQEIVELKELIERQREEFSKVSYERYLLLEEEKENLEAEISMLRMQKEQEKEQEIKLRQKLLHEKDEGYTYLIDDIARGFVHKIRNILGVINGAIEICVGTLGDNIKKFQPTKKLFDKLFGKNKIYNSIINFLEEFKGNLETATQHVAEMMQAVDKFRELSKPIQLDKQRANLNNVLRRICSLPSVKERAQKQNVQLIEEYSYDLPEGNYDVAKLESAFGEIFANAFDALPNGGVIKVQTAFQKENQTVIVRIIDNGVGIPETQIGKVFQPFFTTKSGRIGEGLIKVKRIITLHHGTISLQSTKNKGTTVTIALPL